jgi:hypothetical protein
MKKIILMLLLGLILSLKVFAKGGLLNLKYAEATGESAISMLSAPRQHDPIKFKTRICWISGTVLAGSGGMLWLATGIFNPLSHERDPAKRSQLQKEQRTQHIIAGSLIAASIPLFILAKHYSNQGKHKTVFNFKMEPVDGYQGQSTTVAAIGVSIGL